MLPLKNIKKIIAVASGKGGVGKSTVAVNLALALAKSGASVGILDADIYGPSQPTMLGLEGKRPEVSGRSIFPMKQYGIQSMSIGYLVDPSAAMMWRGPMIGKAMEQMLFDTQWEDLDYLVIDLPPGTGDIQISLCQKVPVNGAVVVTTPQDLALLDVRRACEMFDKLNVPILGIVENMSTHLCSNCGHEERIFGEGGGQKLASEFGLIELGGIPLAKSIREMSDQGHPLVVQAPESDYAKAFYSIAEQVKDLLEKQPTPPKDYSAKFPKVVVEHKQKEG